MIFKMQKCFLVLVPSFALVVGLYVVALTFLESVGTINLDQLVDGLIAIGRLGLHTVSGSVVILAMLETVKVFSGVGRLFLKVEKD
jgi:hypothetical protein